jgi:hypothetical protein
MDAPRITCLFHDATSVTSFLQTAEGRAFGGDLLVECAAEPALSFVLNLETPANYPGVAGLLGGVDLGTLAHPSENLPAPIILAPGGRVARTALRAALARLQRPDERLAAITLLVPVSEARMLGSALTVAERFAVAWDVSACPHEEIVEFARWLAAERLCDEESFAGLFPYATAKLGLAHGQRLKTMLGPLALRAPAIRDTITSA